MIERPEGIVVTMPINFLLDLADDYLRERTIEHLGKHGVYTEDFVKRQIRDYWSKKIRIGFGYKSYLLQMNAVMQDQDSYWLHKISAVPTIDVLYAYITVLGKIRYRANIGGFEEGGTKTFQDGRDCTAKHWMILTHPFVKAPEEILFQGCQGFRYTSFLF